jgi:hypothetical protein
MRMRPPPRRPRADLRLDDTLQAYHSSSDAELAPRRFLHVGTLEQATMRGGAHLHRLTIRTGPRMPRLRDRGSWNVRTLMRHACRSAVAVYLNRHEGIPLEEFDRARSRIDIDRVPDADFRRALPSAADSWIILDPDAVLSIERIR